MTGATGFFGRWLLESLFAADSAQGLRVQSDRALARSGRVPETRAASGGRAAFLEDRIGGGGGRCGV